VDLYAKAPGQSSYSKVAADASAAGSGTFSYTASGGDGSYRFYTVAIDKAGNVEAAPSAPDGSTLLDTAAPASFATAPASVTSGAIAVSYTASDNQGGSGLASVELWAKPPGANGYTKAATSTSTSGSGSFSYTASGGDGTYSFYAIAVDNAGNRQPAPGTTNAVTTLDTTAPSAFQVSDPGQYLRATVKLSASSAPTDAGSGMASVVYQYRPTGGANWSTACTTTAAPWSCGWNTATTATPDGQYDLRTLAGDRAGNATVATNTPLTARTVDNTAPTAKKLSTTNVAGGTKGRAQAGDTLSFAYSETMSLGSILAGWTGASTAVQVRMTDNKAADTLTVWKADGSAKLPLTNPLALGGDYVPAGGAVFKATMVQSGATITITLGSLTSGGVQKSVTGGTLVWTPSAGATDLAGNASSTIPVSAPGPAF
jgi:hypothetical protein